MAGRARRHAVAGDDADRLRRAGDPAVSAKNVRTVAACQRILAQRRRHPRTRKILRPRRCGFHLRRDAAETVADGVVWETVRLGNGDAGKGARDCRPHQVADQASHRWGRRLLAPAADDPAFSQARARGAVTAMLAPPYYDL